MVKKVKPVSLFFYLSPFLLFLKKKTFNSMALPPSFYLYFESAKISESTRCEARIDSILHDKNIYIWFGVGCLQTLKCMLYNPMAAFSDSSFSVYFSPLSMDFLFHYFFLSPVHLIDFIFCFLSFFFFSFPIPISACCLFQFFSSN